MAALGGDLVIRDIWSVLIGEGRHITERNAMEAETGIRCPFSNDLSVCG